MGTVRGIGRILGSKPTIEGAGVRLKRAFGYYEAPLLDPFLLLDNFHSDNPEDYVAGFPWHPHRGIETVTYMLYGSVEHGDSMGNRGVIGSGDVQWMTAGSGIVHQEMPQEQKGGLWGFQLWVNLPSAHKMMPPRYRDVRKEQIPEVSAKDGVVIKVISGAVDGTRGPVQDLVVDTAYLDVTMPPHTEYVREVRSEDTVCAYLLDGGGRFGADDGGPVDEESLVVLGEGDLVAVRSGEEGLRFLLISGAPIGEPVAWRGPIVMNTEEELDLAFREYREGTFIKQR